MANLQFIRGDASSYFLFDGEHIKKKYEDCIYFATDTHEIYMNGVSYAVKNSVIDINTDSDENLVIKFLDGSIAVVPLSEKYITTTIYLDKMEEIEKKIETIKKDLEGALTWKKIV